MNCLNLNYFNSYYIEEKIEIYNEDGTVKPTFKLKSNIDFPFDASRINNYDTNTDYTKYKIDNIEQLDANDLLIKFKKDENEFVIRYPIKDFKMVFGYKVIRNGGRKKQKKQERIKTRKNKKNKSKNTKRKFVKK
jgi:hypothetical protein